MLGFQTNSSTLLISNTLLTLQSTIQEITGINLNTRLIGIEFQSTSGNRISQFTSQFFGTLGIQHPVMVVTITFFQLIEIVVVDTFANAGRFAEIHGRSFYRSNFTGSDKDIIYRSISISIQIQFVIEHALSIATEVKVRVIGQIDNGRLVGGCFVSDNQRVAIGKSVSSFHFQFAGETHFAIGRSVANHQLLIAQLFNIEHAILITFYTTVQTIGTIVHRNLIINAINRELTFIDTIAITTDQSTEVAGIIQIRLNIIETQHDVGKLAILIGRCDRNDTSTIINHGNFYPIRILQNIQIVLFTVDFRLEISSVQLSLGSIVSFAARSKHQTSRQSQV